MGSREEKLHPIEVDEPLINPEAQSEQERNRKTTFPILYPQLWQMYKEHQTTFWLPNEVNITDRDINDYKSLSDNEKYFVKHILGWFAASDVAVLENLSVHMMNKVANMEAKHYYTIQMAIEGIHSEVYSLFIEELMPTQEEKDRVINAVHNFPAVKKKIDWAEKWINDNNVSFHMRVLIWSLLEGVGFVSSFAAIFWLKERDLLETLSAINRLIQRDESHHATFAIELYNHFRNRLDEETVHAITEEMVEVERQFVRNSLPVSLIGMNEEFMVEYIQFVADTHLKRLGYSPIYGSEQPFDFIEKHQLMNTSASFFEQRVFEYSIGASGYMSKKDGEKEEEKSTTVNNPEEVDF